MKPAKRQPAPAPSGPDPGGPDLVSAATVGGIARTVASASSLDEALAAIVGPLRSVFALRRAAVVVRQPGASTTRFAAVWSAGETVLDAGTEAPESSTFMPMVAEHGAPMIVPVVSAGISEVLRAILEKEGVACELAIPLIAHGHVAGMLLLGSEDPDGFAGLPTLFFLGLEAGIEQTLLKLARA